MVSCLIGTLPAFGDSLLAGFENTLATSNGNAVVKHTELVNPTQFKFVTTGATEGSTALEITHPGNWLSDIQIDGVAGPLPLAQLTAQSTTLAMDVTTSDLGVAGDGLYIGWRQVFIIFNGSVGGWQQTQIDFPVAGDDGSSFTTTVELDLTASIAANAAQVAANGHWQIWLVFQGVDNGPIQGDYNNDGSVDAADYTVWRNNVGGSELTNETVSPGSVDTEDYQEWKNHFAPGPHRIKTTIDNIRFLGGPGAAAATNVPEPSTLMLVLLTSAACYRKRRRGI